MYLTCTTADVEKQYMLRVCLSRCVWARVGEWCVRVRAGVDARAEACPFERIALLILHSTRIRNFVYGLSGSTTFLHIIS